MKYDSAENIEQLHMGLPVDRLPTRELLLLYRQFMDMPRTASRHILSSPVFSRKPSSVDPKLAKDSLLNAALVQEQDILHTEVTAGDYKVHTRADRS